MTGQFSWVIARLAFLTFTGAATLYAQAVECPAAASHIDMARGSFSSQPGVVFQLRNFHAALVPLGKSAPLCFEKLTVVSRAEIFVSNQVLNVIFSEKLKKSDSKIKDFKVKNGLSSATLSGSITRLIPIHFAVEGPVTTNGTDVRLSADRIKADGIPVKALLAVVGEHLNSVLKMNGMSGVSVEEDALLFSPEKVAHLKGHITQVATSPEGLTLRYGPDATHHGRQTPRTPDQKAAEEKPR